jgi:hypothetical protein
VLLVLSNVTFPKAYAIRIKVGDASRKGRIDDRLFSRAGISDFEGCKNTECFNSSPGENPEGQCYHDHESLLLFYVGIAIKMHWVGPI